MLSEIAKNNLNSNKHQHWFKFVNRNRTKTKYVNDDGNGICFETRFNNNEFHYIKTHEQ